MKPVNPSTNLDRIHETQIRVRYQETDGQGHVHHANYINYFEIGRTEMLRSSGTSYREFEATGTILVVADVGCQYFKPAYYDDLLTITTTIAHSRGVRIRHEYDVNRDDVLIASGFSVVVCVDRDGKVKRLPDWLRLD